MTNQVRNSWQPVVGWLIATVLVGLLVPGGGVVVALVSLGRWFQRKPPFLFLVLLGLLVLAVQLAGLMQYGPVRTEFGPTMPG